MATLEQRIKKEVKDFLASGTDNLPSDEIRLRESVSPEKYEYAAKSALRQYYEYANKHRKLMIVYPGYVHFGGFDTRNPLKNGIYFLVRHLAVKKVLERVLQ